MDVSEAQQKVKRKNKRTSALMADVVLDRNPGVSLVYTGWDRVARMGNSIFPCYLELCEKLWEKVIIWHFRDSYEHQEMTKLDCSFPLALSVLRAILMFRFGPKIWLAKVFPRANFSRFYAGF